MFSTLIRSPSLRFSFIEVRLSFPKSNGPDSW